MKNRPTLDLFAYAGASACIAAVPPLVYLTFTAAQMAGSAVALDIALAVPLLVSAAAVRAADHRMTLATGTGWCLLTGGVYGVSYLATLGFLRLDGPGNLWPIEAAFMTTLTAAAQGIGCLLGTALRTLAGYEPLGRL